MAAAPQRQLQLVRCLIEGRRSSLLHRLPNRALASLHRQFFSRVLPSCHRLFLLEHLIVNRLDRSQVLVLGLRVLPEHSLQIRLQVGTALLVPAGETFIEAAVYRLSLFHSLSLLDMADKCRFLRRPGRLLLRFLVVHVLSLDVLLPLELARRPGLEKFALKPGHLR